MREEKFKMERQGLIQVGDKVKISEFLSATNYRDFRVSVLYELQLYY